MPWRDVVRFAVAIPAPLAVAVAVEGGIEPGPALGAGVFATMGALAATLAPQPGPLRDQLRRIVAAIGVRRARACWSASTPPAAAGCRSW